jgi:hypothetical protein
MQYVCELPAFDQSADSLSYSQQALKHHTLVEVKVNVTLEQAMKAQRGSRNITVLFL